MIITGQKISRTSVQNLVYCDSVSTMTPSKSNNAAFIPFYKLLAKIKIIYYTSGCLYNGFEFFH